MKKCPLLFRCLSIIWCSSLVNFAVGQTVLVTVEGEVEFNQVLDGFLGNVEPGDGVQMTFEVEAQNFTDSNNFPTRGYEIDLSSFSLSFAGNQIALQSPFPANQVPYFVVRNDDPAVDGFFVSTNVDFPIGVPIDQQGIFDQFSNNFAVTYEANTLDSLSIIDAVGTYDFSGLTEFNWTIDDGPFQPMGILFSNLEISGVPEPHAGIVLFTSILFFCRRRRELLN